MQKICVICGSSAFPPRRSLPYWAAKKAAGADGAFVLATRPPPARESLRLGEEVAFHPCIALFEVDRALRPVRHGGSSTLTNRRRRNMIFVNPNALTERWRVRMPHPCAFSNASRVHRWNLMIDVIVQSGRYPVTATNLAQFVVEGEKRY